MRGGAAVGNVGGEKNSGLIITVVLKLAWDKSALSKQN